MKKYVFICLALVLLSCGQTSTPINKPFTINSVTEPSPLPPPSYSYEHGFLRLQGVQFVNENGFLWQWRGVSSFALFQKYLEGEDIHGILSVYKDAGANTVRVFGMYRWQQFGYKDFVPQTHGDNYFTGLSAFADAIASHQMRLEFTIFTDGNIIDRVPAQQVHAQRTYDALRGKWNVFIELTNEADINRLVPAAFTRPSDMGGVPVSAGSMGGMTINSVVWDYATFHSSRGPQWWTDVERIPSAVPMVYDEPMGGAEFSVSGRRDNVPEHFYAFGSRIKELEIAGATFHSEGGLHSDYPGPLEAECMKQMFLGMQ